MSFFKTDYSNASGEQITPGVYEVFIYQYSMSKAQSGNTVVNLFYQVRDDIQQKHNGAKVQYDNFVETMPAKWKWDTLAKAVGIPDGMEFNNAEEWAQSMINKDLKIKVVMGEPNSKGDSYPSVKGYYKTDIPSNGRPMPINENNSSNSNEPFGTSSQIDISDDDLPF